MAVSYTQFVTARLGKKVDYDGVFQYQCVDLIKQYIKDLTGHEPWVFGGAAAVGYDTGSPFVGIQTWVKIPRSEGVMPRQGDVIFWWPSTGNSYGHVAIVDSIAWSKVTVIEQNGVGGGNGEWGNAIRRKAYMLKNTLWRYRYITPLSPADQKIVDTALASNSAMWKLTSDATLKILLKETNTLIRELYTVKS